jgi:hypothetical protein
MSDHISEDLALVLAALDRDDPERGAALAHAETCPACTRLLERGASLLGRIDAQEVAVTVDPALKARILASIDKLEQEPGAGWEPFALAIGLLLSIAMALFDARSVGELLPGRAPLCLMWQMLGALFSLAGISIWARGWALRASPLRLATVAMGGALVGQLWLHVRCPTHHVGLHVFAFHVTGVLFAALIGYLLARSVLRPE